MTYHQRFKTSEERFSEKYAIAPSGCWEWKSERAFYPKFWTGDGYEKASRYIWQTKHGVRLSPDQQICHRCDNPRCVNPEHLFVGSLLDNMRDKVAKGRSARCPGEKNGRAKLSQLDVEHIKRWRNCGFSQQKIADGYAITQAQVSAICLGKNMEGSMKVGVLVPCYQGTVHWDHYQSMMRTVEMGRSRGIDVVTFTAAGCPVLPRVRNFLLAKAIASGCDWAAFIDDDIAWNADDFFRLIGHGVDVVAAAPAKRHHRWDETPSCAVRFPREAETKGIEGRITKEGRLWNVSGLATAFMAIKISALDSIKHLTTPYIYDGVEAAAGEVMRNWFWYKIIDAGNGDGSLTDLGEDYYFCDLITEAGGKVWVDPDIRLRHYDGNVCHDFALCDTEVQREAAA